MDAGPPKTCNNVPIGGGYGKCGPPAPGCSQLGAGIVLPAPFDMVTQTCSTDQDCSMIATNLNVGAILRDITGFSEIHDATLSYPEHVCASVSIETGQAPGTNGNSCHDECTVGGALGAQCGACAIAVCTGDPFCCTDTWDQTCVDEVPDACQKACDTCSQSGMGGHDRCTVGGPLMASCSPCVASLCQAVPDCCMTQWTQNCIDQIPAYCSPVYLCSGQCKTVAQCTGGQGCLATHTCGPCVADYDCAPGTCDTTTGMCQ
jgi:hypothetical protein